MKEPSDTPQFYDPEWGKPEIEYIAFDDWVQNLKPETMLDALTYLHDDDVERVFYATLESYGVVESTSEQLRFVLEDWYEKAKQSGDDDVIKEINHWDRY